MIIDELFESPQQCPECGGISFSDLILAEKKDACYHKVKASAKVWPSAYASGRLVQCRKKGAANYGNKSEGVVEAGFPGAPDVEMPPMKSSGDPQRDKLKQEYVDLHREIKSLVDLQYNSKSTEEKMQAKARIKQLNDRADQIRAILEPRQPPNEWQKKTYGYDDNWNEVGKGVAEANIRRDPLDLPPLEGPGSGGGTGGGGGTSPRWSSTKIPGVDIHTGPPPTVTKPPNINRQIDPASDVPAYVRKGLPDPVTTPVGKPKITVRPGETQSQAIQRTRAEQEFGRFLQGQGGQSFGTAGAGRGGQGGPTAAQATSGSNQVPTIKLPGGQTIPDPYRLSPSGQYSTQSKSNSEMDKIMQKWDKEQRSAPSSSSSPSKSKTSPSKFLQLFGPDKMDEESRKKRKEPEAKYDDQYDAMVARVQKLAGIGPMKTVWDPARRVYKNVPTAQQPKK
jgi:hypothetical protein